MVELLGDWVIYRCVTGSRAYGLADDDSDVDVRGVFVAPPELLLQDGFDLDLVTHDVAKFCTLLFRRNGYVLEQLYSPLVVASGDRDEELQAIAAGCITRNHAHHCLGFADTQRALYEKRHRLNHVDFPVSEIARLAAHGALVARATRGRSPGPERFPVAG